MPLQTPLSKPHTLAPCLLPLASCPLLYKPTPSLIRERILANTYKTSHANVR